MCSPIPLASESAPHQGIVEGSAGGKKPRPNPRRWMTMEEPARPEQSDCVSWAPGGSMVPPAACAGRRHWGHQQDGQRDAWVRYFGLAEVFVPSLKSEVTAPVLEGAKGSPILSLQDQTAAWAFRLSCCWKRFLLGPRQIFSRVAISERAASRSNVSRGHHCLLNSQSPVYKVLQSANVSFVGRLRRISRLHIPQVHILLL